MNRHYEGLKSLRFEFVELLERILRKAADTLRTGADKYPIHGNMKLCVLVTRDRLANKFRRAILRIGQSLESIEVYGEATAIYQRAIDLDNLSEDIYQRLIFCLKKLGKDAEALNVFRRCRDMLSIVLGVSPSRETRALVHLDN